MYKPVCVLICLLSKLGLSKAFEQTPHGNKALSRGLALGVGPGGSGKSPCEEAADDALSPETLLCSSSVAEGGEPLSALDSSDIDRSSGESTTDTWKITH